LFSLVFDVGLMIAILKAKAVIGAVTESGDSFDEIGAWPAMASVNTAQ
jgi:hypothetical protein